MAVKKSVTIPLTAKQKDQIKRATGKTINAVKVARAGSLVGMKGMKTTKGFGGPGPILPPNN